MDIQFVSDSLSMFIMFIILSPCLSAIAYSYSGNLFVRGVKVYVMRAVFVQCCHMLSKHKCTTSLAGWSPANIWPNHRRDRVLSESYPCLGHASLKALDNIDVHTSGHRSGTLWDLQLVQFKSQLTRRWSPQGEARNPDLTRCARCARCRSLNSTFDAKKMLRWIQSIIMIFVYALYTYTHHIIYTCYMHIIMSICIYFTYMWSTYMSIYNIYIYILCVCVPSMLRSINCSAQPLRPSALRTSINSFRIGTEIPEAPAPTFCR